MLRKTSAIALMVLILISHFNVVITLRVYATGETDVLTALKFIEGELEKGRVPSGSITETCFTIPEGFPVGLAQMLWFFIAQLVSIGGSEEEIRRIVKGANDTLRLPARIDYDLKDYSIIPGYEKICVHRNNDGSVSVEIPYKVVDRNGNERDASSIKYESNGTNIFHILHRYPKKRTYLVRFIDPDSYTFTLIDLETGKIFNKTARMKIGLFSNLSQSYFLENFLVAIPGHFEETREAVQSQVSEFRVLLPAYDPIIIDTTISSTKVGIGDTIAITAQIRNPQDIRESYRILLGARFSNNDAFEAWASPPSPTCIAPLYLRAKKPGIYTITIYFAVVQPSNLDVVFWNGGKTITYTIEVLPEPPRLEIKLSSQAIAKFANLSITLVNKGGRKAKDVKLLVTGDVDGKELEIGTIVGLWSKNIITRLLSPIARLNITIVYYDEEGKRYASTALTTISTTNFMAPEEWRSYVVEVEEYNETKRVFTPGYQGATHLKLYFMTTDMVPGYLQDFDGVKLIPISPDGFTLTIENASDLARAAKTLNVKYALIDAKPGFLYERILREDEVKKLFDINEDERLEPSKIPPNYEVKLLKEEVLNRSEIVMVNDEFYEQLKYNGWEDHDYKYEDTGETRWDLDKAATRVSHGREIELIYHPLAYGGGDLVQGVLVRNYVVCNVEYELEVFAGPMRTPPEEHAITVSAFGSIPLHLVQLENIEYPVFINLKHGNRVVATLLANFRKSELPEFWKGFWDGFVSKGWGIIVTCGLMIIVGVVLPPKWAVAASTAILATGVAMNIAEVWTDVHNALAAMDSLNELADVCEGRAKEFNEIGMAQHANELFELSQIFRLEARDINDNLLSDIISNLALDTSWGEIRIAFGLKEPPSTGDRDYRVGYATGRAVGAIVSCAAYVATFSAVVNKIRAERTGGKPLSVKDVLRIVGRGIWNWITPAIFDVVMLKLKPSFHKMVDLLLGNKYSRKFGDVVGGLIERISGPSRVEDALETVSGLSKHILENVPSKESSGRILDAISALIEHYSLEELEEKGRAIARSTVSIWIKDGDEAIELLSSWLSENTGNLGKINVLEKFLLAIGRDAVKGVGLKIGSIIDSYLDVKGKHGEDIADAFLKIALKNPDRLEKAKEIFDKICEIFGKSEETGRRIVDWLKLGEGEALRKAANEILPRLIELEKNELDGIGKALAAMGDDFDNGLKLIEAFLLANGRYEKKIVEVFLDNVAKHPENLDMWTNVFTRNSKIVFLEPHAKSHESLVIEGRGIDPGVYWILVIDQELKEMITGGVRDTAEKKVITFKGAQFDVNKEYLTIFMRYTIEDFFKDLEAQPKFVKLSEDGKVVLATSRGEPIAEMEAEIKAEIGFVYLEFKYNDIDGDVRWFRLSSSGELWLKSAKGETISEDKVMDLSFRTFDDGAGKIIAKLIEIKYGEEASSIYLAMERDILESGMFFIHDKDGLFGIKSGQMQLTLGKDFEKMLGKGELEKLKNMLEGEKAVLVLVYVGEDNNVHEAWSSRLKFGLQHPAKEGGVMGLYVVRMDGVEGVDAGGMKAQLRSTVWGGYELVTSVKGKELRISVKEAYIKAYGPRRYLKMELKDGNLLGFRMFVDDNGKMHAELAIPKENTFRDLRLVKFISEIERYCYQDKEFVLRNILVGEYVEEGKTKHVFMSIYGDVQKEILDRLNTNPEHTMLEIWAIDLFKSKEEEVIGIEKRLEDVGRIIDVMTKDKDGVEILIECKHGTEVFESGRELQDKMGQIEGFFTHANSHRNKVRLFIGEDLTGDGAKKYVKRAIELHEQLGVPLEIYIKGELKSLSEVKQMVES